MKTTGSMSRALVAAMLAAAPASLAAEQGASAETIELYRAKCQSCHMAAGNSPLEPLNFADGAWKHGSKPDAVARVIADGVPGSAMLAFKSQLSKGQIAALAAHVRSFDKSLKPAHED
jgi:mono/diheme cytochrome c family protein